ncbi:unnamed protein product [Bemisia tabaci]|uniref:YqaJ viral recombinase domain-containing protein n=1 Tax=Bemisia tabaci TaxID=7038 RepID=A0A9P0A994_BEMTA|nr:unnamed protein product [Bemisia tabaci]
MPRQPEKDLDDGYASATSSNLPKVDAFMFASFFNTTKFVSPEFKNVKSLRSTRAVYGDSSIGFVQVKREGNICKLKAEITPEHNIGKPAYGLISGCKHAIAFIAWLERRASEPSPTEEFCYWRKSALGRLGASTKVVQINEISKQKTVDISKEARVEFFRDVVVSFGKTAKGSLIFKNMDLHKSASIHNLILHFKKEVPRKKQTFEEFEKYCSLYLTDKMCQEIAKATVGQSKSALWKDVRFGRVTGSKVHETSRCKTSNGATANAIYGCAKLKTTEAMTRGQNMEPGVIKVLQKKYKQPIKKTGFVMKPTEPLFGASPDGLMGDYIIEIKSPISEKTFKTYFKNNGTEPANKHKAQMQLQMLMCGKKKGLFCVADPDFENNKKVTVLEVAFDEAYIVEIMQDAKKFWKTHIFPHLMETFGEN